VDLLVDVIVNADNKYLEGGGGVCGAIQVAAGEHLFEACMLLGGYRTGNVKATLGFCLPAH
jgi:O-acetyl-ADP-ribose deacetylase (regulator of RNase III)